MDEELKKEMEKLTEHMKIFHTISKKVTLMMASNRVHLCRENKEMCVDIGILANGVVQKS